MAQIHNKYFVGPGQAYKTVTHALSTIYSTLQAGSFTLPSTSSADGGNVNIVLVGGGTYQPFTVPDNMTVPINAAGRRLVITRQELTDTGKLSTASMPVFTPQAAGAGEMDIADKVNCIQLGSNNPGITLRGLYARDATIGIQAGFNTDDLIIDRCIIANCSNVQVYLHDLSKLQFINNVLIGGEYGLIAKFISKIRCYHNTIHLDGSTALGGKARAGVILQGERIFSGTEASTIYFAGNLVSVANAPALIAYQGDALDQRLVSDYNNLFSTNNHLVELRQDTSQSENENDIIIGKYNTLSEWQKASSLGSDLSKSVDTNSLSIDPVFIQKTFLAGSTASVLDLSLLNNSPILGKVPSWYSVTDSTYIPSDLDTTLIAIDILLNSREKPYNAIGANDAPSFNGYFGEDIFTSPLSSTPDKNCDIDPLKIIAVQGLDLVYPEITAGFFWSHERPYYLYADKGACQLGKLARTKFKLPGYPSLKSDFSITIKGKELPKENWDVVGKDLYIKHTSSGIVSYEDEVHIHCSIQGWDNNGFFNKKAYYVFKVVDGITDFLLPETYNAQGPVVITDDRSSLRDPIKLVRREFSVNFSSERNESTIEFLHTDNLVSNSSFDATEGSSKPSFWSTDEDFTDEVFILGTNYAYYGDHAAGIRFGSRQGWLESSAIPINDTDPITLSWHARTPTGLSSNSTTGHYSISWLDEKRNTTVNSNITGNFVASASGYNRYYMSFGHSDQLPTVDTYNDYDTDVTKVQAYDYIPSGVSYLTLTISGSSSTDYDGFLMLDAVQIEHDNAPTYYHPELSFEYMTVEWEDTDAKSFVDKRMNISSVFNERPNGFLCIQDMPATIWNGPSDPNITTLHEYKWPIGRINYLPWARLHGKDKLSQRVYGAESPSRPLDIISPYGGLATPENAVMTPETLRVTQNSGDVAGFDIRVFDSFGNAYPLRRYTMQVYETQDKYPGLLSKKHYGAKEQLGTTIYGELSSNGSAVASYVPPDNSLITYVGMAPKPETQATNVIGINEKISHIYTAYRVSLENNGNVTVRGQSGKKLNTISNVSVTNTYYGISDGNQVVITLPHPPAYGSLKLSHNGIVFTETQSDPQSNEFTINYAYGQVTLRAIVDGDIPFTITYVPKYAYPDPDNPYMIIFHHDKIFGNYKGPIRVDYDAQVFVELRTEKPIVGELITRFPIIIQNPELATITNDSLALEF
jgi:hypothetical protein